MNRAVTLLVVWCAAVRKGVVIRYCKRMRKEWRLRDYEYPAFEPLFSISWRCGIPGCFGKLRKWVNGRGDERFCCGGCKRQYYVIDFLIGDGATQTPRGGPLPITYQDAELVDPSLIQPLPPSYLLRAIDAVRRWYQSLKDANASVAKEVSDFRRDNPEAAATEDYLQSVEVDVLH